MATAANLRAHIEATLAHRVPAAFSLKIRQSPALFSTSIPSVDAILEGGIPRGGITEISGAASTGRTSLVLSVISGVTQSGAACAWVDVCDALSPESAAVSGVVLERLLWLRTAPTTDEQRESMPRRSNRLAVADSQKHPPINYGGTSHPRDEAREMDSAVTLLFKGEGGLLRDKTVGTPGRSNRPISEPRCAEPLSREQRDEQAAYDRPPARRSARFLKEPAVSKLPQPMPHGSVPSNFQRPLQKPWSCLEQGLKATDLLLQAGGFTAVVLDMSDVLPQQTMRMPLATWYRFRLAAEHARTALILMTQSPCARSCAALVLRCESAETEAWSANSETALFQNQQYRIVRERNRNESAAGVYKKPPARADWQAQTEWTRVR